MTKKLVWRLPGKPTLEDLKVAVESGILSKEEAKQMLVREEDEAIIDHDQLRDIKEELKFLREMVLQLSKKEPQIIYKHIYEYIEKNPKPYWWGREWYSLSCNTAKELGDNVTYTKLNNIMSSKSFNFNLPKTDSLSFSNGTASNGTVYSSELVSNN